MKLLPYLIGSIFLALSCSVDQDTNARRYLEDSAVSSGDARPAELKTTIALKEPIFSQDFGLAPNDKIDGKSLFEVLTSQKAGRDDGKTCAECHSNDVALGDYWVPSASDEALDDIDPDSEVAGRSWTGAGGWAERFVANDTKPSNVRAVIQAWIDGGYEIEP